MPRKYNVYKGLQKPLVFKNFKGKYIYWGAGILVAAMILGGTISALSSLWLGVSVMAFTLVGGFWYTAQKQKQGLSDKTRHIDTFVHPPQLQKIIKKHGKKTGI